MKRRHLCYFFFLILLIYLFLIQSIEILFSDSTTSDDDLVYHFSPNVTSVTNNNSLITISNNKKTECSHFLLNESTKTLAGNGRAILALLLTSLKYHGITRLKETLPTWIKNFLEVQGNIDMVFFYSYPNITVTKLVEIFGLAKANKDQLSSLELKFRELKDNFADNVILSTEELNSIGDGYYYLPNSKSNFIFRLIPINLTYPIYIQQNWSLLDNPTWLRCGCPPFCPVHRASPEYVQGTRWYSHDIFNQPIVRRYSFWVKMDVDIAFFQKLDKNLVNLLFSNGRILGHTGYTYNGHGCSDELQFAIMKFLKINGIRSVSEGKEWWLSDDRTYYTNFVIGSVNFFLQPKVRELTYFLNEYYDGFFKHRWTDQSLLHKVMGVFCGPNESDFAINWENLRCTKKRTTPDAVFYHSKRKKKIRPGRPCRN